MLIYLLLVFHFPIFLKKFVNNSFVSNKTRENRFRSLIHIYELTYSGHQVVRYLLFEFFRQHKSTIYVSKADGIIHVAVSLRRVNHRSQPSEAKAAQRGSGNERQVTASSTNHTSLNESSTDEKLMKTKIIFYVKMKMLGL